MLQIANMALEMLTLWDLHNLSIFFVRSSSKATVGTMVFRSFPERFGNEWPPLKIFSVMNSRNLANAMDLLAARLNQVLNWFHFSKPFPDMRANKV